MKERKAISTKTRFEVFKRDLFTCQYCGSHPPSVVLHVDHINPVANGGKNNQDNLITACSGCNLGKGARLLSIAPKPLAEKAKEIAEREAQIIGYQDIIESKKNRLDGEVWRIVKILNGSSSISNQDYASIFRFIEKLGYPEVEEAIELAAMKHRYVPNRFKYFCGICWNKINRGKGFANG